MLSPERVSMSPGEGHGDMEDRDRRTNVLRISLLRGLFDARTMRFPESFLMAGIRRACGKICLCWRDINKE